MKQPTLVVTAHGTDNPVGQAIITSVVEQTARLLPDVRVVETYVDVQFPQIDEVLADLGAQEESIVVPLLLSTGYHTVHDIRGAVQKRKQSQVFCEATPTLGPHPALAQIQVARILQAENNPTHVILVAAGSSDALAQADVEAQKTLLEEALTTSVDVVDIDVADVDVADSGKKITVSVAYLSAAQPTVTQALETAHAENPNARIVLNSYLLAPGFFHDKLQRLAHESPVPSTQIAITDPLGADPLLAQIVVERFNRAVQIVA